MIHTHSLPTVAQVEAMQKFVEHARSPLLKEHRLQAKNLYASLPLNPKEWQVIPCVDVAWETTGVNDFYIQTHQLPNGVVICDIRNAGQRFPGFLDPYLGIDSHSKSRKLVALIEACYNRGALLWVPPGVHITDPLDLQSLLGGYRQTVLIEKLIIFVSEGASVTVADTVRSSHCAAHTLMRSIDYVVSSNAALSVVHDQDLASFAYDLSRITFHCHEKSELTYTTMMTGAQTIKQWLDVRLHGEGSKAVIRGAYVLHENQKLDITTHQVHDVPMTASDLNIKGALAGKSQAYYRGTIMVKEQAVQTHALQNNNTILLSDQAHAKSIPSLEVLTNDVHCSHGSAVGQLDAQQLFYLESRGFDLKKARMVLLEGFFTQVLSHDQAVRMCKKIES